MNNLPTEILLKIFSKIPWIDFNKYKCELKLKLVCKKWNNLIKKYGIDLETDYSSFLVLQSFEVYDFNYNIILEFYYLSSENIEKRILKTPVYQLYLCSDIVKNYLYFLNNSHKIIKFWNKHVKSIRLRKYTGECVYELTGLRSLIIEYTLLINVERMKNKSILKHIKFINLYLKYKELFEILDSYPNLNRIEFIDCRFHFSDEEKLSDILNKPFKNEINIYFYNCYVNKREFNNEEPLFNSYYSIDRVLFTLKDGKWKRFDNFVSNEPFFYDSD
jgi:hypothetical protein